MTIIENCFWKTISLLVLIRPRGNRCASPFLDIVGRWCASVTCARILSDRNLLHYKFLLVKKIPKEKCIFVAVRELNVGKRVLSKSFELIILISHTTRLHSRLTQLGTQERRACCTKSETRSDKSEMWIRSKEDRRERATVWLINNWWGGAMQLRSPPICNCNFARCMPS